MIIGDICEAEVSAAATMARLAQGNDTKVADVLAIAGIQQAAFLDGLMPRGQRCAALHSSALMHAPTTARPPNPRPPLTLGSLRLPALDATAKVSAQPNT